MNKIVSLVLSLSIGVGVIVYFTKDGESTLLVVTNRLVENIKSSIGKGDIAIQKYQNEIIRIKENLIKLKVNIKVYEQKIESKKSSLTDLSTSDNFKQKEELLAKTIIEMEVFLTQMKQAETDLTAKLKKMVNNLDLIKMQIKNLETKRDIAEARKSLQNYSLLEDNVEKIDSTISSTIESLQQDIYEIEAELELEKILNVE